MERRPNQVRAYEQTIAAINGGATRVCVTSPTGSGKTKMMTDMIEWAIKNNGRVALYTYRRMLFDQTVGFLEAAGIDAGKRASGHERALLRDVQICMTQTELSQVYRKESRDLHDATLVLIDEAHNQKADTLQRIMADHIASGAAIVGYTATPLDIGNLYDELIIAGGTREGIKQGYLVAAHTYGPDEPDLRHIKNYVVGEDLSERENAKAIMRPGVFGRVKDWYRKLNPEQRPTILFAPDVKGSIFFAQEFTKSGVPSAHIDGTDVWVDGEFYNSDPEVRQQIMDGSKAGDIKVVCNRFVLREGIDAPWLSHGIFATVFGSLTSFLQSGGRLLRAFAGKDCATIQDHGGNWHRHGSLNEDREWSLEMTGHRVTSERQERMRERLEHEPIVCPACGKVRDFGRQCPACGYESHTKSRMVVQIDGSLIPMTGDIYTPRRRKKHYDTAAKWEAMYYRMKRAGKTFRQAEALFCIEHHYWPPRDLPLMPKDTGDWYRKIESVPMNELT